MSLPVSLDGEWKLCEKAGQFIPNELLAWLHAAGIDSDILDMAGGFVRNLAGGIAGSLPAVFCGSPFLSATYYAPVIAYLLALVLLRWRGWGRWRAWWLVGAPGAASAAQAA